MSVSFRTVGTWAELTADGAVAIPATPQAGDRMYLFARWKDFSVTATVANWTELVEFADGAVTAGNGTGSVKVACWYRDWQSGDTDPAIDFSASPDNASAVIIVMAKEAADEWLTPVAVTAAMTNWTTTSQIVAASSTAAVLGGGVVMGLIGIRDDTATMTRPTSGIDDSAGAVTWNGNYVEAPATHHSTTTAFDGAADLGYRLVSTGATATLRMTGTISAAETGAALWVVQGVEVNLVIQSASHDHSAANLALTQAHSITVANASHAQTAANTVLTQVHVLAVQNSDHTHTAESLTFTQVHVLTIQSASHDHASQSLTLEVIHHLTVQGASHDHVADGLTIEVTHHLVIQGASHSHEAESVTLTQVHELVIANSAHAHTASSPNVRTFQIVYLDPGGDATQTVGHFNAEVDSISTGTVTFDSAQQVVGVGSYKFDSGDGSDTVAASVNGIMDVNRRVSMYFRYDSVPDAVETLTKFPLGFENYSDSGFFTGQKQVETATIVGTITGSGNAKFSIATDFIPGSGETPLDVSVAVLSGDTAAVVAGKAAVELNNTVAVADHYTATTDGADLILTARVFANNDGALNIAYTNDTCTGLTPDATSENTAPGEFTGSQNSALFVDDGSHGLAAPAKNAGQGAVLGSFGFSVGGDAIPIGAVIDLVKIIYERKYDVNTSIGISRVKWRVDGVEGPDHDNTDMPLTDTVVEVDVTGDREWTREVLANGVFEVIAEARRGDTDTAHTQSWDYLKVEVQWHLDGIISVRNSIDADGFQIGAAPRGDGVVLRVIDKNGVFYFGITELLPNVQNRISFAYVQTGSMAEVNLFVNSIPELSLVDVAVGGSPMANLRYGWIDSPGVDHLCWFDQIYIDDGDNLQDLGNRLMTAKLPASVNENNWSTTVGTGAVNERPLSETNHRRHNAPDGARQTYTLQTASVGDVDLSGQTFVGHMGWAWAKSSNNSQLEEIYLITNNVSTDITAALFAGGNGVPLLLRSVTTSTAYPSNAAGIGMTGNIDDADIFLYECGAVVAYIPQPVNPNSILSYQELAEDSITNLTDDLRSEPQSSYELCYRIDESGAHVLITVYSIYAEGQEPQLQCVAGGQGGYGRTRITPGIEVQITVEVTGGSTGVAVWRRVNVG